MIISLDTETNGIDIHHGCLPFFVTGCREGGSQSWWEWDVDPDTRRPEIPDGDVQEIQSFIDKADEIVFQNSKFDIEVLSKIDVIVPWSKVHDTLISGHILASNQSHDLTSMALLYLGRDISPYEKALKAAVREARATVKSHRKDKLNGELFEEHSLADWTIAEKDDPNLPASGKQPAACDYWLPRAVAKEFKYQEPRPGCDHIWDNELGQCLECHGHHWHTVLQEYSNIDSVVTLACWLKHEPLVKKRGYWEYYLSRIKLPRIAGLMERYGVTAYKPKLTGLRDTFTRESQEAAGRCMEVASNFEYDLELPKGPVNNSLLGFCFGKLNLPLVVWTDSGKPSIKEEALVKYSLTLSGEQLRFVQALAQKRKRDTAITYMNGYERFWIPLNGDGGWYIIHPSLNPTGSDTLRWSHSNPNQANISKDEDANLRSIFGPRPGREWYCFDAENIELRIPAYESGQEELIDLFERSKEPPFYGSEHLLNFSVVYPDIWEKELREVGIEKVGPHVKEKYESSYYQWCKNGDFAIGYQAGDETADKAFRRPGSRQKLIAKFEKKAALNKKYVDMANLLGYVETIPDRTVNPKLGYPIMCSRQEYGKVKPTIPLNYHIQSTACWWMCKAMIRVQDKLDEWKAKGFDGHLVLQIHDELVVDFPVGTPLWRVKTIKALMERGGEDFVIKVPTPVSVKKCSESWDKRISV
jgi:DNA polymerase I-like protein with 3'-5' exonuclease and polymerase domains